MSKVKSLLMTALLSSVGLAGWPNVQAATVQAPDITQKFDKSKDTLVFNLTNAVSSFSATIKSSYENKDGTLNSGFDITRFQLFSGNTLKSTGDVVASYPNLTGTRTTGGGRSPTTFTTYEDKWTLSTGSLAAGTYKFVVGGNGSGNATASYSYSVAAVPEPETYAMLLTGLALVGGAVYRRAKKDRTKLFSFSGFSA